MIDPIVTKYITDGIVRANEESVSRAAKVQVSQQSCQCELQHLGAGVAKSGDEIKWLWRRGERVAS
jgi:hypothetical protein